MIPASAAYLAAEAALTGAYPVARFILKNFPHKTGAENGGGTFVGCAFVAPDRIQAAYAPAAAVSWTSDPIAAGLGFYPSPAVFIDTLRTPGFTALEEFRLAPTAALLAAAPWMTFSSGDTVQLQAWYQRRLTWTGYRAWVTEDPADDAGGLAAYACEDPDDAYVSYASDALDYPDRQAYGAGTWLLGQYPVPPEHVIQGGEVSADLSTAFGQVITGEHTVTLDNSDGRYSPRQQGFIWPSPTAWKLQEIEAQLGFVRPGTGGRSIDTVTVWRGLLNYWGQLKRSMSDSGQLEAQTVDLYSKGLFADLLEKPLGIPNADGLSNPLFYGKYLAQADQIEGWSPFPPQVHLDFDGGNLFALDHQVISGGVLEASPTDPLAGSYSLRSRLTDANQQAQATKGLFAEGETLFLRQKWCWVVVPDNPVDRNLTFLVVLNAAGSVVFSLTVRGDGSTNADGSINAGGAVEACLNGAVQITSWNLGLDVGVEVDLVLVIRAALTGGTDGGRVMLWVNGNQVLKWTDVTPGPVQTAVLGLSSGAAAETWEVLQDDVDMDNQYLDQAYRVGGGPFRSLGDVYVGGARRTANLDLYPQYGVVNFTDAAHEVSGQIEIWVDKDDKSHFADQIQDLIEAQGERPGYLDLTVLAAAKAATPEYQTACRFACSPDSTDPHVSSGSTIGDALNAIGQANALNFIEDHGVIKVIPYLGTPPAKVLSLRADAGQLKAMPQTIKADDLKNWCGVAFGRVGSKGGLTEDAHDDQDIARNGQKADLLDLTFGQSVATNSRQMARLVAQRRLQRLSACRDLVESVSWLEAARLELGDGLELFDAFLLDNPVTYGLFGKRLSLGPTWLATLTAIDFL